MCEPEEEVITVGKYVVVKKLNFKKIYKVTENGRLTLGKDAVDMREIIGKRFWTTFEMVPSKSKNLTHSLKEATETESWNDLLSTLPSGNDNRTIIDDGTSQKLSKEEILQLQESGKTGKEIVESLIENNTSFLDRTEYSQEKYLKKKEKKYAKYLTVCKPNITLLHDIYFKLDHSKIGSLRMDALAQVLSYSDVQSEGLYMIYDSGSQGLPTAAMLNRIGANTQGQLINLHPGNLHQSTLIQAMNFSVEQLDRLANVNIYSFLRLYHQGEAAVLNNILTSKKYQNSKVKENKSKETEKNDADSKVLQEEEISDKKSSESIEIVENNKVFEEQNAENSSTGLKRKLNKSDDTGNDVSAKRPKWFFDTQRAVELVKKSKVRGLAIIAKEHPLNIVTALLPFLGPSRPFVIYHIHREPLQEIYMALKQRQNVINLRLFSNFLRSYQVLPDRTHPDILTSDTGGYILTGYLVE